MNPFKYPNLYECYLQSPRLLLSLHWSEDLWYAQATKTASPPHSVPTVRSAAQIRYETGVQGYYNHDTWKMSWQTPPATAYHPPSGTRYTVTTQRVPYRFHIEIQRPIHQKNGDVILRSRYLDLHNFYKACGINPADILIDPTSEKYRFWGWVERTFIGQWFSGLTQPTHEYHWGGTR